MPVQIPDDTDFTSFKEQCENHEGWLARYTKGAVTVWCRTEESHGAVQKLKASRKRRAPPRATAAAAAVPAAAAALPLGALRRRCC